MSYFAGLDFGTAGARIAVITADQTLVFQNRVAYDKNMSSASWADGWLNTLQMLLQSMPADICSALRAIAFNGTSATVLLCDEHGQPITSPLLYNDDCGKAYQSQLAAIAPSSSPALSATSSLAKVLCWRAHLPTTTFRRARYLLHQADWLAFQLHGKLGLSDYHNALKLGYDIGRLTYPNWLLDLGLTSLLPCVQPPGTLYGNISAAASERYGLHPTSAVVAGTTDSIAAFLASGAQSPGEAVTSLGSTLVTKLLSHTRVDDPHYGIYSHRLGDLWLVGGASNTGGAVLQQFFTDAELRDLSAKIPRDQPAKLDYYPLTQPGERFPINDPELAPRLMPRPEAPEQFLHGLLESMARIEARGYRLLEQLGATPLRRVLTAGGGAQNPTWQAIRQRLLPVPVEPALSTEAAFGTAKLAQQGWRSADT